MTNEEIIELRQKSQCTALNHTLRFEYIEHGIIFYGIEYIDTTKST